MTDPTSGGAEDRPAGPLVLNALRDVVAGTNTFVEDASVEVVREIYREATTGAERRQFEAALDALRTGEGDEATVETIRSVVDAVLDAGSECLRATVVHDARFDVSPVDAHLYGFGTRLDGRAVEALCSTDDCRAAARDGLELAREGDHTAAAGRFEDAVGAAGTDVEGVGTRVMAAWAHHWSGADGRALEFVRTALERDPSAWSARMVGFAADDEFADLFRRGTFGMRVYLRITAEVPESSTIEPVLGTTGGDAVEWTPLGDRFDCLVFPRLSPETRVRLRLAGPLDAFPALHGYHVSLGAVNLDDTVARTVERVLFSGPAADGTTERARFERVE